MKVHGVFLVAVFFYLTYTQLVKGQLQPHEGCQTRCGEVEIKYPFGISSGCYYPGDDSFNITCKEDRSYVLGHIEVTKFTHSSHLQVLLNRSSYCDDEQGKKNISVDSNYDLGNFSISTKNKLTLVGCNALALVATSGDKPYATVCISACESLPAADEKCDGEGCCTTDIFDEWDNYFVEIGSTRLRLPNQASVHHFHPCVYAFLVEGGKFNFSPSHDLMNLRNKTTFPVLLDWSVGNQSCQKVGNTNICGENSVCANSTNRRTGYICKCKDGYEGNPYLSNEHGCQGTN